MRQREGMVISLYATLYYPFTCVPRHYPIGRGRKGQLRQKLRQAQTYDVSL